MWRSWSLQDAHRRGHSQQQRFPEMAGAGGTHVRTDAAARELVAVLTAAEKQQQPPCPPAEPRR